MLINSLIFLFLSYIYIFVYTFVFNLHYFDFSLALIFLRLISLSVCLSVLFFVSYLFSNFLCLLLSLETPFFFQLQVSSFLFGKRRRRKLLTHAHYLSEREEVKSHSKKSLNTFFASKELQ